VSLLLTGVVLISKPPFMFKVRVKNVCICVRHLAHIKYQRLSDDYRITHKGSVAFFRDILRHRKILERF
jgi:hypothetical protein